jgi:hypothetical protein
MPLAPRSLATLAAMVVGAAACCPEFEDEFIDLGPEYVFEDLLPSDYGELEDSTVGVGPEGLIAAWAFEGSGKDRHLVVDTQRPTSADLHAIGRSGDYLDGYELFAVGSDGTILNSQDGSEWITIEIPGVEADLWAVGQVTFGTSSYDQRRDLVIVGDDTLIVRDQDGAWHQPTPPVNGWGSLRALTYDDAEAFVFGLDGVAWSSPDPTFAWAVEKTGAEVDLLSAGRTPRPYPSDEHPTTTICAGGVGGTVVCHDQATGWRTLDLGTTADIVGFEWDSLLSADGELWVWDGEADYDFVADYEGRFSALAHGFGLVIMAREDGWIVERDPDIPCRF